MLESARLAEEIASDVWSNKNGRTFDEDVRSFKRILDQHQLRAPSAWYRVHVAVDTPMAPGGEVDVDMVWGDDKPEGDGWHPLYA